MTRKHFQQMADMVKAINHGQWTNDTPAWANVMMARQSEYEVSSYVRAVQTAEAFVILAQSYNPRFDKNRFLRACGLV